MSENRTVAVLGTGIMGAAMARNIVKAGHEVRAWNRTRERAEPLAADGITISATPREAVSGADVIITILFDGATVLEVMDEAAPALAPGTVWLQSTTAGIELVGELASFADRHGLAFYDAPVLGTRQPAEAGKLTVLAAGPTAQRPVLEPVLSAVGVKTVWTGEDGSGGSASRLKLVANSWVLGLTHAVAETMALAEALDVAPQAFLDTVAGGPLDVGYLRTKSDLILNDKLTPPAFAVDTAAKDTRLVLEAAASAGVKLDVTEAGAERFRRAAAQGHGGSDMAASYHASFDK
jgi:3-hydroxyisobutyrate dehydrogenase